MGRSATTTGHSNLPVASHMPFLSLCVDRDGRHFSGGWGNTYNRSQKRTKYMKTVLWHPMEYRSSWEVKRIATSVVASKKQSTKYNSERSNNNPAACVAAVVLWQMKVNPESAHAGKHCTKLAHAAEKRWSVNDLEICPR